MLKHNQGPQTVVGVITAAIFLLALLALVTLGDYRFLTALFLALLIAMFSGIVLYLGFCGSGAAPASKPAPAAVSKAASAPQPAPAPKQPAPAPKPAAAAAKPAAPAASAAQPGPGARPRGLDAPKGGAADDLKLIKGIGPKLETVCNSLGFWHFDQIAAWSPDEVAWVDENLQGFKGRVTRDNWIEQAKSLAKG